jgi:hypothetical protein
MDTHQPTPSPSSTDSADSIPPTPEGYSAFEIDTIFTAIRCILIASGVVLLFIITIYVLSKPTTILPRIILGGIALSAILNVWKIIRRLRHILPRTERDLELGAMEFEDEEEVLLEERGRPTSRPEAQELESHKQVKRSDVS